MIVFATAITNREIYERCAAVGFQLAAEPDSEIWAGPSIGSIFQSYNAVLDRASKRDDLEALVLAHQDTQIFDPDFGARVRAALQDPEVGVVGCVGAIGVRSIAWWEGSVALASFVHRFDEHGGGDLPAFSWTWSDAPPYARTGEVDTLDGFLLVLSPWVVHNLRFDESLGQLHGYDYDFCLQVRAAGRKVVTEDFRAIHSHPLEPFSDPESWIEAHMRVAEKWDGRMPGVGTAAGTWEDRALRAEAERDVARLTDYYNLLQTDARIRELEGALAELEHSVSWRMTAPLRAAEQLLSLAEGLRSGRRR
ncbi:MAG TPA: glycosyltransferase [Solirubrobacteraceae bacterium]